MSAKVFEVVALAYEALGKLKSLRIAAKKRNLGDDVLYKMWDEVGRLQTWASYLCSKVSMWNVPPNSADTGRMVLNDLHEILDGAISIVSTLEDGSEIDRSVLEDNSEPGSIHDILQDIAEVVTDVCTLDLVYYNSPTCDGFGPSEQIKGIDDPSKRAVRPPSIIASTVDSTIDDNDVFSVLSYEEGTITSTAPSRSSDSRARSGLLYHHEKLSGKSPMQSDIAEELPRFSEIDRRTEEQKSVAASRLMSWLNTDQPLGNPTLTHEPALEAGLESQQTSNSAVNISAGSGTDFDPHLINLFEAMDKKRVGYITEQELGRTLVNADFSPFDQRTISMIYTMFHTQERPGISSDEFQGLWGYLAAWRSLFEKLNQSGSGNLTQKEFFDSLTAFGYRLSRSFTDSYYVMHSKAPRGEMPFDLFVQACVRLKLITDWFKAFDEDRDGFITLSFEESLAGILRFTRLGESLHSISGESAVQQSAGLKNLEPIRTGVAEPKIVRNQVSRGSQRSLPSRVARKPVPKAAERTSSPIRRPPGPSPQFDPLESPEKSPRPQRRLSYSSARGDDPIHLREHLLPPRVLEQASRPSSNITPHEAESSSKHSTRFSPFFSQK